MYIIGLTGGIASGKSTVACVLKNEGAAIIDADLVSRDISKKGKSGYEAVKACFGNDYITEVEINRKELGRLVFSDKDALFKLNSIMLPLIKKEIESILNQMSGIVVIDAPLLFEAGLDSICDSIWAVIAETELRITRITERDGLTRGEAEARIAAQKSDSFFEENSDVVIVNSGNISELHKIVKGLLDEAKVSCK